MIVVCIPGDPVGKQSVRVSNRGGFVRKYMPAKTRAYELRCSVEAHLSMDLAGKELITGPVELKLQVFLPIPKSWSKKKRAAAILGKIVPTKKPDTSNVLKAVEDGFTGVVWRDDCQVVDHHMTKRFSEEPCVIAIVTPLDLESS